MNYQIIPVTPFMQNCTLLWCPTTLEAAIVDPGGDPERIDKCVSELGLKVKHILLTHGHIDHAGASATVSARYSATIIGPAQSDLFWIEGLPEQSRMFGFPQVPAFVPDRWLQQGDIIHLGDHQLEVRCCPGHTPGHVVFVNHAAQFTLVGDVIFQNSIGRTDFPQGDLDTLLDSIRTQLMTLPDEMVLLPGHGPATSVAKERRYNPFLKG